MPGSWLSRRRRRVIVAAAASSIVIAGVAAAVMHRRTASQYDPSAPVEGITAELERRLPADHPKAVFRDVAAEAGVRFHHFPGVRSTQLPEDMGSGAAWGDFDGDGDDDLYIVNVSAPLTDASPQPSNAAATSRLFRNDRGAFVDVTEQAGVGVWGCGIGAAWADADRDGRLDLVVSTFGGLRLFRNRGEGTFDDATAASGLGAFRGFWTGLSWADYDRDGDLDLYVCGYVQYTYDPEDASKKSSQFDAEVPYVLNPSSYRPQPNLLLRNDGRGRFTDVATAAGVVNSSGRSLSASWADFDDDGWIDLYVANDVSDNALYRNLGNGRFEDVSHPTWVADPRGAMGLAVGDWDLDGDFDIFVTHWLAQENALFSNMRIGSKGAAAGKMVFMDVADQEGLGQVSLDFVKWGTSFFDYDNDGRPDLLSVNGSTFQDPKDTRRLIAMRHHLFWNRGDREGFYDVAPVAGAPLVEPTVGRGAAFSDYDQDGDVDVLVVNHGAPARLLRNDGGNARHWLAVRARGAADPQGLGAVAWVTAGGRTVMQQVGAQPSYVSQNSSTLHFGLGDATRAETVRVRFASGREAVQRDVAGDQVIAVAEPK
jgi:hypothetical protein